MSRFPSKIVSEEQSAQAANGLLVGRFARTLDPKKRLTIPSEWRTALGLNEPGAYVYVVANPTLECLNILPRNFLESRLAELEQKAIFDDALNEKLEAIGENVQLLEVDSQGRIRISNELLDMAGLKDGVVLKGLFRMAQIWATDKATLGTSTTPANRERYRESVKDLGL